MSSAKDRLLESRRAVVDQLLKRMQQGELFWQRPWDSAALVPRNPYSGAKYRGGNRLRLWQAIMDRGYTDPRWMTYAQIQKAGYRLRDAKGTGVMLEHWRYTKTEEIEDEEGNKKKIEIPLKRPIPGFFYVFNGSFIDGLPPYVSEREEAPQVQEIGERILSHGVCPVREKALDNAFYSPELDEVVVPPRGTFSSPIAFYSTVLHEQSHATGHPTRLNRESLMRYDESLEWRAKEEFRAELGAVFLCAELGISLDDEEYTRSSAYLQHWEAFLQEDGEELFSAAADAERICDYFMDCLQLTPEHRTENREQESREQESIELEEKTMSMALFEEQSIIPCENPSGEIVFDVETTGLNPETDEILQISIIDGDANVLLNAYVKPYTATEWPDAERINGITPESVKDCPQLHELAAKVRGIFASAKTWISYNGEFDLGFLAKIGIQATDEIRHVDVMRDFAPIYGMWDERRGDYKWQKLITCAAHYGYTFCAHDSLEDVRATLFCYRKMQQTATLEETMEMQM